MRDAVLKLSALRIVLGAEAIWFGSEKDADLGLDILDVEFGPIGLLPRSS
jgi:hypothetical protein